MVETKEQRYGGHKSLAEMVDGHIHVWREALKRRLSQSQYDPNARDYFVHELKALEAIEIAVKKDLQS